MIFISIFDKKSGTFQTPRLYPHVADALRSVQVECRKPDSALAQFAADFAIYRLGEFHGDMPGAPIEGYSPQFVEEVVAYLPSNKEPSRFEERLAAGGPIRPDEVNEIRSALGGSPQSAFETGFHGGPNGKA